ARHTILVADSTKFERSAPVRIGHISQLSNFVTDQPLPQALSAICIENGVDVVIAGEQ
ncbi:MAG: DeoR/GlpR transcriptional regulator, partial [Rhodospirillales bacterium]|nr:DeoR/GlpR transcriptional regulator [Rhodospirillales bacterium]